MTGLTRRTLLAASGLAASGTLAGCARPLTASPRPNETTGASPDMTTAPSNSQPDTTSVLLVFFSRPGENYWEGGRRDLQVGNTEKLAQMIAGRIACDVYEMIAADPYPDAYDPAVERNVREQEAGARPEIQGDLPDVAPYDTVLLGSPVWNSRAPMIMSTFVENTDLSGRIVLPFVTYAVSGMSGVDEDYREALPDSEVRAGLAVRGEAVRAATRDLEAWLTENRLL